MTNHSVPIVQLQQIAPQRDGDLSLPRYMTPGAAGCDLVAAIDEPVRLAPLQRVAIPTGLKMAIPQGYEGQVRPRSGLAFRQGLTVLNAPGTIDSDYRGEVKVLLVNLNSEEIEITRGQRIAQLIVAPVSQARLVLVEHLDKTDRGDGGFGSTGA